MRSVISANAVLLPTVRQVTPDAALISIAVTAAAANDPPIGQWAVGMTVSRGLCRADLRFAIIHP